VVTEPPAAPPVEETVYYQPLASVIQRFISKGIRRLLITSSGPKEGRSTITANLGRSLARRGATSVVLVDADHGNPTLHTLFGLENSRGLGDLLSDVYQVALEKDRLNRCGLGDWLELVRLQARSGSLTIVQEEQEFSISFRKGAIASVCWPKRPEDLRVGTLLVRAGKTTEIQRETALVLQQDHREPLGHILCRLGYIEPADLNAVLQSQLSDCLPRILTLQRPDYVFSSAGDPHPPATSDPTSQATNGSSLDHPSVTRFTANLPQPFLSGAIRRYLLDTENPNLKILPTGPAPFDLFHPPTTEQFTALLRTLSRSCDLVLVDSPPLSITSPAATLATLTDGVILIIEAGRLDIRTIQLAKQQLEEHGANILGVILNRVDLTENGSSYLSYGNAPES
jgi:Mrp family chromosome partitioning ATPase